MASTHDFATVVYHDETNNGKWKIHSPEAPPCTDVPLRDSSVFRASCNNASWRLVGWTTCTRKTSRMVEGPQWMDGTHPACTNDHKLISDTFNRLCFRLSRTRDIHESSSPHPIRSSKGIQTAPMFTVHALHTERAPSNRIRTRTRKIIADWSFELCIDAPFSKLYSKFYSFKLVIRN